MLQRRGSPPLEHQDKDTTDVARLSRTFKFGTFPDETRNGIDCQIKHEIMLLLSACHHNGTVIKPPSGSITAQ
ncbi:hypothetical protein M378DRAFT_167564 [Amanita muscaria Koide BX008]|uniref:Uncharacterized protein n=1 Tax=Amanita muscaria (strain Koide BX008) TaxID=946122 RepID=A0A0C2WHC4_AMAMK|nr:hypothetical protein M378DRAFT_167564 [Amanita muscaria Koide BX008]